MKLSYKKILKFQKNRKPYLFIDYVYDIKPGSHAFAKKKLKKKEWFFKIHWPGNPNMPGALQAEAMVQTAALIILSYPENNGKIMYLESFGEVKFKRKILPNSELNIRAFLDNYNRGIGNFSAEIIVSKEIACKGKFRLILPEEHNKFKIVTK